MKRGFEFLTIPLVFAGGMFVFLCTAAAVDKPHKETPLVKSFFHPSKTIAAPKTSVRRTRVDSGSRSSVKDALFDEKIEQVPHANVALAAHSRPASNRRPSSAIRQEPTLAAKPASSVSNVAGGTEMRVITKPVSTKSVSLNTRYKRLVLSLPDEAPEELTPRGPMIDERATTTSVAKPLQRANQDVELVEPGTPAVPIEISEGKRSEPEAIAVEHEPSAAEGTPPIDSEAERAGTSAEPRQPTLAVATQESTRSGDISGDSPVREDSPVPESEPGRVKHSSDPVHVRTPAVGLNHRENGVQLEWKVPEEISTNVEAECQLVVRNPSDSTVYRIAVYVELPPNVKLGKATANHRIDGPQVIWEFDKIEARGQRTLQVGMIPQTSGSLAPRAAVTFTQVATTSFAVLEAKIQVDIEGPDELLAGQMANYSLLVSNLGTGPATNVSVKVRLDEKLRHSEGTDLEYTLGTIPAGELRRVEMPLLAGTGGSSPIAVSAVSHGEIRAEAEHLVRIVEPKLELAVEGPKLRYLDRKANYLITVHNPGPAVVNNVQILDAVPEGLRFDSAGAGGTYDRTAKQVAWFIGRMEPEQTVEVAVKLIATEIGHQPITTVVKADAGVRQEAQTMTLVEGIASVVLEVADEDDPVEVQGETIYQIRVSNQGSKPANEVQIAVALPKELDLLGTEGPTDASIGKQKVVFAAIGSLEPDTTMVYRVRVRCLTAGHVAFRAFCRTSKSSQTVSQEELTRIYAD